MKLEDFNYQHQNYELVPGLSQLQTNILKNRDKNEDLDSFLYKDYDILEDLDLIPNISRAAATLRSHLMDKSNIAIVSDCDCDGITSAATTYRILKEVFHHPEDKLNVIINKRKTGNSFTPALVKRVKELHNANYISLMYSCDQGSLNGKEYRDFAKTCGFDMIITDHHQVRKGELYPDAKDLWFVNPQDSEEEIYPFKQVSGCVVTLLVLIYTYCKLYYADDPKHNKDYRIFYKYMDLPAVSIVSDIMSCDNPLNRWIYKIGLNEINKRSNPVFQALRFVLEIPGKIELSDIKMKIAPLINAANRMDVEELAYDMITQTVKENAIIEAERLVIHNSEKKATIKTLTKDLIQGLDRIDCSEGIIVTIKDVPAVNGILAGKIGSLKGVPTICFMERENMLSGSCRAIVPGFDLIELFTRISKQDPNIILNFGGHKDACGVHIDKDYLEVFQGLFFQNVKDMLKELPEKQNIVIDYMIKEEDIDLSILYSQNSLAPFGKDFKEPIFLSILHIKHIIILGDIARITFKRKNGGTLSGFYNFGTTDYINMDNIKDLLQPGTRCITSFTGDVSSYANAYDINLNILKIDIL